MLRCLIHTKVSYYLLGRTGPGPALSSRGLFRFLTAQSCSIIYNARVPACSRARNQSHVNKTRGRHYLNKYSTVGLEELVALYRQI